MYTYRIFPRDLLKLLYIKIINFIYDDSVDMNVEYPCGKDAYISGWHLHYILYNLFLIVTCYIARLCLGLMFYFFIVEIAWPSWLNH